MNEPGPVLALDDCTIRLHDADNVVVAKTDLPAGATLRGDSSRLVLADAVPAMHKLAVEPIPTGAAVRKYDQVIGSATRAIAAGAHVHSHNLAFADFQRNYAIGADVRADAPVPAAERATFQGIVRPDGRVATRNYIAVVTSVNCSATAARYIAESFRPDDLADYPNVDGVVAFTHGHGCGMAPQGDGFDYLRRSLAGYATHPNVAGFLLLGLGCEVNQVGTLAEELGLPLGRDRPGDDDPRRAAARRRRCARASRASGRCCRLRTA